MQYRPSIKVAVRLTVEVDLDEYRAAYGEQDQATIREEIRYAALDGIRAVISAGISSVDLAEVGR